MTENRIIANNGSSIVLYTTDDGNTQLEVKLEKDTVWLTQSQMAELFDKDQSVIARHIKNAFNEGEVNEKSNMQILHNTQYKYRPTKMVHGEERNPLFRRRQKAYSRQHPRCLTLMIAESRTEEKDVMVKVVVNLINKDNQ